MGDFYNKEPNLINRVFKNKLLIISLLFILICIPGLNLLLYDDEGMYIQFFSEFEDGKYPSQRLQTQPIMDTFFYYIMWLISSFFLAFLQITIPYRLYTVFFGLLTLIMTYKFAKLVYDEKTALITGLVLISSFYFIFASLKLDFDGNLLTFFIISSFYLYYLGEKEQSNQKIYFSGILFGLAMLIKYTSIIIPITLFFYEFFILKKRTIPSVLKVSFVGSVIFMLFPLIAGLTGRFDIFLTTFNSGIRSVLAKGQNLVLFFLFASFKHAYRILQYGTPLLFFIPLLAIFANKKREEMIFFIWLVIGFITLIFVTPQGDLARYQMILIPPLAIITGAFLNKHILKSHLTKKNLIYSGLLFCLFLIITIALNLFKFTKEVFAITSPNLDIILLNPDVWYVATSGPAFIISLFSLIFFAVIGFLLFLAFIYFKKEERRSAVLIIIVLLSLSFNFLLIEEHFFYGFSPNYNTTINEMVEYYNENRETLGPPIFSINEEIPLYLGYSALEYYDIEHQKDRDFLKDGGTGFFLNLDPRVGTQMWKDLKKECTLVKTFYSKGYESGFIFRC